MKEPVPRFLILKKKKKVVVTYVLVPEHFRTVIVVLVGPVVLAVQVVQVVAAGVEPFVVEILLRTASVALVFPSLIEIHSSS